MQTPPEEGWRPAATWETLSQRAEMLGSLRRYFADNGVLEVETPLLASAGVTDPHIPGFITEPDNTGLNKAGKSRRYLNTSPEFAMKRLLAAGSGPIYQVCKAFRQGEQGRLHNPEFTLLEWYRPGFDHHQLMDEVATLVGVLIKGSRSSAPEQRGKEQRLSYAECFQNYLGIDPHEAEVPQLRACAQAQKLAPVTGLGDDDKDGWLDLLMSHCIQPHLGQGCMTFVYDYPVSQAALAKVRPDSPPVAERFELFMEGIELANGFHELQDAQEQRARFEVDLKQRQAKGLEPVVIDEYLLAALTAGLPDCAGVALGLDRLQVVFSDADQLKEIMGFPFERI